MRRFDHRRQAANKNTTHPFLLRTVMNDSRRAAAIVGAQEVRLTLILTLLAHSVDCRRHECGGVVMRWSCSWVRERVVGPAVVHITTYSGTSKVDRVHKHLKGRRTSMQKKEKRRVVNGHTCKGGVAAFSCTCRVLRFGTPRRHQKRGGKRKGGGGHRQRQSGPAGAEQKSNSNRGAGPISGSVSWKLLCAHMTS